MLSLYEFLWNVFNSKTVLIIGAWASLSLTLILIVMFVRKQNRDERGWKIKGKASAIAFIYLIIMAN